MFQRICCFLCLAVMIIWSFLHDAAYASRQLSDTECYYYQEKTGDFEKNITWKLTKDDRYTLTYSSESDQYITVTDTNFDTLSWQVTEEASETDFHAVRFDNEIIISGTFKGNPVNKTLKIDTGKWYQSTTLSLRELIFSEEKETAFWIIRFDTLSAHRIKAVKQNVISKIINGTEQKLLKIKLTLTGLLSSLKISDCWFCLPDGVFYKYVGPGGPVGFKVTTVVQTGP